jgi:hypothetical protein
VVVVFIGAVRVEEIRPISPIRLILKIRPIRLISLIIFLPRPAGNAEEPGDTP